MENTTIKDVVLDKKLDNYGWTNNDFQASQELMVTITLHEYRELISDVATKQSQIDEANKNKYEREREIETVKKENDRLKTELYELKKKLDNSEYVLNTVVKEEE